MRGIGLQVEMSALKLLKIVPKPEPETPSKNDDLKARRKPKIAIIIPAYNEEKNIKSVLDSLSKITRANPNLEFQLIVVNDGSTDQTEEILDHLVAKFGIKVISHPLNLGIGRAVQTGFQYAVKWGADVAIQFDGDGQHPAEAVPQVIAPILAGKAEVVVGSRYIDGAGGNVSSPFRQAGTLFFSRLLGHLVGAAVKDTTSGFRAFSYEAAEFLSRYYPDDYPEVEAYVPLARHHFEILEVPVKMNPRRGGKSSISPMGGIYYMVKVAFATAIDAIRPLPPRKPRGSKGERL